jgi:hypothetical protein
VCVFCKGTHARGARENDDFLRSFLEHEKEETPPDGNMSIAIYFFFSVRLQPHATAGTEEIKRNRTLSFYFD